MRTLGPGGWLVKVVGPEPSTLAQLAHALRRHARIIIEIHVRRAS
jgi:hypothetical protein